MFASRYSWRNTSQEAEKKRIDSLKKLDGSALPPCSRVLLQKIKRTHLIAMRWHSATQAEQNSLSPLLSGWKDEDDSYRILWVEGDISPKALDVLSSEEDGTTDGEDAIDGSFFLIFAISPGTFCQFLYF